MDSNGHRGLLRFAPLDLSKFNYKNKVLRTGFDDNMEYKKWKTTDNIDFYH